jgi:hypothetical protein
MSRDKKRHTDSEVPKDPRHERNGDRTNEAPSPGRGQAVNGGPPDEVDERPRRPR